MRRMYAALPMASGGAQPTRPDGQRHSGVVHGGRSRSPTPQPRRDWLLGGLVAGVTVAAMLLVANVFAGRSTDVADVSVASASPTPTTTTLPIFVQESPNPTATPTPSPSATPV